MYRVQFKASAAKQRESLDGDIKSRVDAKIDTLAENPRPAGAKKLKGSDFWRVRIGDHRVVYSIADDVLLVLVVKVGHRRDIYRCPARPSGAGCAGPGRATFATTIGFRQGTRRLVARRL